MSPRPKNVWRLVLPIGSLLGIVSSGGCSGKVEPGVAKVGDPDGGASRGGSSGSAGAESGGFAGSVSGGAANSGGSGGVVVGPYDCRPLLDEDPCIQCARRHCCVELITCGRDQFCMGYGEFPCISRCIYYGPGDSGIDETVTRCMASCAKGANIAPATENLITCLNVGTTDSGSGSNCRAVCFGGNLP